MMVMFGMIIAVGILVDGAIVVVEYADRKMAEGMERADAYAMAGKRMFWPVVASSATTLAAFVPFLFWDSIARQVHVLPADHTDLCSVIFAGDGVDLPASSGKCCW